MANQYSGLSEKAGDAERHFAGVPAATRHQVRAGTFWVDNQGWCRLRITPRGQRRPVVRAGLELVVDEVLRSCYGRKLFDTS
jgi:hypothetical protein